MALEDAIQQQFIWAFEMLLVRRAKISRITKWTKLLGFPPTFSHSFSPIAEDEEEDEIFDSVRKGEAGGVARRLDEDDEDEDPVLR